MWANNNKPKQLNTLHRWRKNVNKSDKNMRWMKYFVVLKPTWMRKKLIKHECDRRISQMKKNPLSWDIHQGNDWERGIERDRERERAREDLKCQKQNWSQRFLWAFYFRVCVPFSTLNRSRFSNNCKCIGCSEIIVDFLFGSGEAMLAHNSQACIE